LKHIKQLAGQTAVYGIGIVIPRFLNLLLIPFYTNVFDPGEYGIITELYAYVVFLIIFLTYGLETGFFRYSEGGEDKNSVFKTALISILTSSLFWLVLVFLFYGAIAEMLDYKGRENYILWLGLIVGIDAFSSIPFAKIRLQNRALKYAIIRIIEVGVNIGLNLFFILYCHNHYEQVAWINKIYNPEIRIGYVLVSNLIASLVKLLLLSKEIFSVKGSFNLQLWKRIMVYSLPLLIAGLAGAINEVFDRPLLKLLVSEPLDPMVELGLYGANFKLAMLVTIFIQMFRYAAEPFFFSKMNDSNAKTIYADVMKYFVFATLVICLGVLLYIDVFKYFIGPEYWSALGIVPIILAANVFMGIYYNLAVWFKLTNKTKYGAFLVLTGAAVTIITNVIFIPDFSFYASAWGHFAAYFIMVLISYFLGRKYYKINYDLKKIGSYMAGAIIIYLFFSYLKTDNLFLEYLLKTVVLIIYLIIFVLAEKIINPKSLLKKLE
jgi:O-antigen/teichoic acid export membrane protein